MEDPRPNLVQDLFTFSNTVYLHTLSISILPYCILPIVRGHLEWMTSVHQWTISLPESASKSRTILNLGQLLFLWLYIRFRITSDLVRPTAAVSYFLVRNMWVCEESSEPIWTNKNIASVSKVASASQVSKIKTCILFATEWTLYSSPPFLSRHLLQSFQPLLELDQLFCLLLPSHSSSTRQIIYDYWVTSEWSSILYFAVWFKTLHKTFIHYPFTLSSFR